MNRAEVLKRIDSRCPRELLVSETRRVLDRMRERVKSGQPVAVRVLIHLEFRLH